MKTTTPSRAVLALAAITFVAGGLSSAPTRHGGGIVRAAGQANAVAQRLTNEVVDGFSGAFDPCSLTANLLARASIREAQEDFGIGLANCVNLTDPDDAFECLAETLQELRDTLDLIGEQYDARVELCDKLGGGPYDPDYEPEDFVSGIDNPLLPYAVGNTWTYEADTEDGLEVIVVTVTPDTIEIDDVECTVVRDTVTLDGELIEDTFDYYAQDVDGNVWYFGELSLNYEDGMLTDLDGSWITGEEYAKPGIVMFADPEVGETYRQEYLPDEAEDAGTVLSEDEDVSVPAGMYANCLETEDFTPLEPDVLEYKYYAPGIGLVLEVDSESGERVELVSFN